MSNDTTGIEELFVRDTGREYYGLPVVEVDGAEYAKARSEEQADSAALEKCREDLWAFNMSFLRHYLPSKLSERHYEAIQKMQDEMCEDAGPIIEALLGDRVDEMLSEAIRVDGRGHGLSLYDGKEYDGADIHPALDGCLLYRM